MDIIDAVCQKCKKGIRIVRGTPELCRACASNHRDKTAGGWYFRKGTRIIAPGRKKNDKL